jgi:hypothetical protein
MSAKSYRYSQENNIFITDSTSLVLQLFRFVKFSFPVTPLLPYYAETGSSNCETLRIALMPLQKKRGEEEGTRAP